MIKAIIMLLAVMITSNAWACVAEQVNLDIDHDQHTVVTKAEVDNITEAIKVSAISIWSKLSIKSRIEEISEMLADSKGNITVIVKEAFESLIAYIDEVMPSGELKNWIFKKRYALLAYLIKNSINA
ncbi:MAG: hypothetical protein QF877_12645 [Gammaproteobacteria bacterium]|nr:hypothetical protein [Gammaproteobacteria bacterium]